MKTNENIAKPAAHRRPGIRIAFTAAIALLATCAFGTPPTIVSTTPNSAGTELYLKFSLLMCTSTPGATHIPNYTVVGAPGVVSAATMLGDGETVRLDFAPALAAGTYNLAIASPQAFLIYDSDCLIRSNALVTPVSIPFTVTGTSTGPEAYWANPAAVSADCGSTITIHGSGFDADATLTLIPASGASPIPGLSPSVNSGGTTITATIPGGAAPGNYSVVIKNPTGSLPNQSVPFPLPVSGVKLDSNWPNYSGDCAPMTVAVTGNGFCAGATMVATPYGGGTPVTGTAVQINSAGNQISATLDFSAAPQGYYDLTVQNPGGTADTLLNGLSVGFPSGWVSSLPKTIGNCGTISITVDGSFCSGDMVRLAPVGGGPDFPGTVTSIAPGGSPYMQVMSADFNMAGATPGEYVVEFKRGVGDWTGKFDGPHTIVVDSTASPLVLDYVGRLWVGYTKVNHFAVKVRNLSCSTVPASTVTVSFPAGDNPNFSNPLAGGAAGGVISPDNTITYPVPALAGGQIYTLEFDLNLPNLNTIATLSVSDSFYGSLVQSIGVFASQDPNAKSGLAGNGANHAIVGNEELPYEIHFENMASASAPAQDVFVTDHLNPAQFDLSTFSLGEITFGGHTITPPPGLTSFSQIIPVDLDGDPATTADQMLLAVKAALVTDAGSPDYGRITWSYRTLDLVTLDTPTDVTLGFLPPNKLSPTGEGSVKFNVKLKSGMRIGTQLGSAAVIVFDANAPLSTNPWFNQIASPVPLVIRRVGASIQVEWFAPAGLFTLEQATQPNADATWMTVAGTPATLGNLQRVTMPASGTQNFFRLRL